MPKVQYILNVCGGSDEFACRVFDTEGEVKAYVRANPVLKPSHEDDRFSFYGQDYSQPLGYSVFKVVDGVPVMRAVLWDNATDDDPEHLVMGGETITRLPSGPIFPDGPLRLFYLDTDRSLFVNAREFLDTAVIAAYDRDDALAVLAEKDAAEGPDPDECVYPSTADLTDLEEIGVAGPNILRGFRHWTTYERNVGD